MAQYPVESHIFATQHCSLIAVGTVSPIYAIDSHFVIKRRPKPSDDFACQAYNIEIRAYERLGDHPQVAKVREVTADGIIIERGECLRQKIQSSESTIETKLRWTQEAAAGHVKYIDFSGSGIDGEAAMVCYEWCSYRPGSEPNIKTDIFAFGSTLFEIETGEKPYQELEKTLGTGKLMRVVEQLFATGKYPRVDMLVLGDIILRCWNGDYHSMDEVSRDIDACCQGIYDTGAVSIPSSRRS
ncbi:hypothetical protein ABOM_003012 [Aspergillus bombycis]|uniref:Protein kinase domain-containing protein n=1 Tax=Aspergillus bombycis TaxID=109264 RepID=A0A1F8AAU6_9EURO|nr:hypothetical protein ABOM_003012 [Aspergillus bombycis]OGM48837.1 hypothetical protein ABOM_003012 [Aspergillus bombycis]